MTTLFRILMRALARLLRSCAEYLSRHAEKEIVATPLPEGPRTAVPPADWIRRANPPPPAHWMDLVRRRAPQFLESLPVSKATPQSPGPRILSRLRRTAPSGPAAPPAENRDRKSGFPSPEVPPPPVRTSAGEEPARRRVRVVTRVDEVVRRSNSSRDPSPEAQEVPAAAVREDPLPLPQPPEDPESAPVPPPVAPRLPAPRPEPEGIPPRSRPAVPECFAAVRRPAAPVAEFDPFLPKPRFEESRFPTRRAFLPEAPFHASEARRFHTGDVTDAIAGGDWPDLPKPPDSGVTDECLALVRELRRRDAVDAEQRGLPWSA